MIPRNPFRRRQPTIEFVTFDDKVREMFPPVPAAQAMPDWFTKMSGCLENRRFKNVRLSGEITAKGCPGIVDYMSQGFVIPLWADYLITAEEEGFSFESSYQREPHVFSFGANQMAGFTSKMGDDSKHYLKINVPWFIRTSPGWSAMLLDPWYHQDKRFTVVPGVVDTDRLGIMNFTTVWHVPVGETALLRAGVPVVHVVPFRRSYIRSEIIADKKLYDEIQGRGVNAVSGSFRLAPGTYREHRNCKK